MKKIVIAILTVLLVALTYVMLANSITIGNFKIASIKEIKAASSQLNSNIDQANSLTDKTYPENEASLKEAIANLKIAKQKYESKNITSTEENALGTVEINTYKIHYLWTRLGNYKKNRSLKSLNLDLKTTQTSDVYDLEFTLAGEYSDIIEFLYDIENDEELNFQIEGFEMEPYTETTTTTVKDGESNKTIVKDEQKPYDTITEITTSGGTKSNTTTSNNNTTDTTNNNANNENQNSTNTTSGASSTSSSSKTTIYDPKWLKVTFTVEDVGITLD